MATMRLLAVTGLTLALAGCGSDGNDAARRAASGSFFGEATDDTPRILVVDPSGASATDRLAEPAGGDDGGDAATIGGSEHDAAPASDRDTSSNHDTSTNHHATESGHDDHRADDTSSGHVAAESAHDDGGAADDDGGADETADVAGDAAGHVVQVSMVEFAYVLDRDTVPMGEPVTFRFVNDGQIEHEAMFGSLHQQQEFASSDGHGEHGSEGHHGEVAAITLDAASSGEMLMIFDSPGEVLIGCHLPGHWEAGMVASLEVVAA